MEKPQNCVIVIFGASGDLTKRKLMPALFDLFRQNLLPEKFAILGVSRSSFSDDSYRDKMLSDVKKFCEKSPVQNHTLQKFLQTIFYLNIDTKTPEEYTQLKEKLEQIDAHFQLGGNYIYYLATPPSLYETIAGGIGAQGLHRQGRESEWKRIIVEKPFGYDLLSAVQLNKKLQKYFHEDQIYRIDHYLGKETVQNTLAFRFANGIFEPLWNRNYIHHVEITGVEHIGVENRGGYYDHAGALRDMVQNHLLQIMGLIAMESPPVYHADAVRNETVKVFQSLSPLKPEDVSRQVVRGQLTAGDRPGEVGEPAHQPPQAHLPPGRSPGAVGLPGQPACRGQAAVAFRGAGALHAGQHRAPGGGHGAAGLGQPDSRGHQLLVVRKVDRRLGGKRHAALPVPPRDQGGQQLGL